MGYNIFEKIILQHSEQSSIQVNDIVEVTIDKMMVHDFFLPFCIDKFYEMGFKTIQDPSKAVFIYDHLVPTAFVDDCRHHREAEKFIKRHDIPNVHRSDGVCHQLMPEQGYVRPGDIVVGTDSHTVTYGALGALATGIGYTEMAGVLGSGKLWLNVCPSVKVEVNGTLPSGSFSKDVILKIIHHIKNDGAIYKVLEFEGNTIEQMTVDSRLTLSNMCVEAGAKAGIIAPDNQVLSYLAPHYSSDRLQMLESDPDAEYENHIEIDVSDLEPQVACPFNVDNVKGISELVNMSIDQAFLGSCTNGRLEDLSIASRLLEGKKIHPGVRLIVTPASRQIFVDAVKKGYIETLAKAGAIICHPSCGLCAGRSGGILENGDRVIASNNRNFLGRMGGEKVEIFLASPATVAASALEGKIADCRDYLL